MVNIFSKHGDPGSVIIPGVAILLELILPN
jgi:hypothetical protein